MVPDSKFPLLSPSRPPKQNTDFSRNILVRDYMFWGNSATSRSLFDITHPPRYFFLTLLAASTTAEEKMFGSFAPLLPSAIVTRGSVYWKSKKRRLGRLFPFSNWRYSDSMLVFAGVQLLCLFMFFSGDAMVHPTILCLQLYLCLSYVWQRGCWSLFLLVFSMLSAAFLKIIHTRMPTKS